MNVRTSATPSTLPGNTSAMADTPSSLPGNTSAMADTPSTLSGTTSAMAVLAIVLLIVSAGVAGATGLAEEGATGLEASGLAEDPARLGQDEDIPAAGTAGEPVPPHRHVPSPEWQDQVIYFVLTDRFADGEPSNNDQGAGEYDPQDGRKYSGGDLAGIRQRLDYIQELGATAVWITPPVKNQWWDPLVDYGGYHGYWASDPSELDPHVGTLAEYQQLAGDLHRRGMYLIQDVVVNHMGNFFTYDDAQGDPQYDPKDPTAGFRINTESVPVSTPGLFPLSFNDVRTTESREANIYHWTPDIQDESVDEQRLTYQLFDLDDLNTENPVVRDTLRQAYGKWVREVGVDAFRLDTAIYVSHEFWNRFLHAEDTPSPGIFQLARRTGREDFLAFGEAFVGSGPMESGGEQRIARYLGSDEEPGLNSMINFPLYFTMDRVFAGGKPTRYLEYRLEAIEEAFPRPELLPVFLDNHDTSRFLTRTTLDGFRQALMFMMTVPGIPVIYQGTEQGFTDQRAAMFAGGYGSGGEDHYDTESAHFTYLRELIRLRRGDELFTRGEITVHASTERGAGVLAYSRRLDEREAYVLMNTSDTPVLVNGMETGLEPGAVLAARGMVTGEEPDRLTAGPDGHLTADLPPRAGVVLLPSDRTAAVPGRGVSLSLEPGLAGTTVREDVTVRGSVSEPGALVRIAVNGALGRVEPVTANENGRFSVTIPVSGFPAGESRNTLSAYAPEHRVATDPVTFTAVVRSQGRSTTVYDPVGDALGPEAAYTLPTADPYGDQLDLTRVTAALEEDALVVTVRPAELAASDSEGEGDGESEGEGDGVGDSDGDSDSAGGPALLKHAAYHVFLDLPEEVSSGDGRAGLSGLAAAAPDGFAWDYAARHAGGTETLHAASAAGPGTLGEALDTVPQRTISRENGTVTYRYPLRVFATGGEAAGDAAGDADGFRAQDFVGTRVYVTSWGWDPEAGGLLPLREEAGSTAFGGRTSEADPLVLDQSVVFPVEDRRQTYSPDPAGDDTGPSGEYQLPTDPTFGDQMDIRRLSLVPLGGNLQVELRMEEITRIWGPPNGFDHVMFHVFIDLPGRDGVSVLPRINATAPPGLAWDFMGFHEGWNNRLYSSEGAGEESYGTVVTPQPEINVDQEAGVVRFTYSARALGNPENLEDAAVYVTTWDWDGPQADYRGLVAAPTQWNFGGGDDASDPLIMDSVLAGLSTTYTPPEPDVREVTVRFVVEEVPGETPDDATLYLAGPFNNWTPDHEAFTFSRQDGRFVLEWEFDAGTDLEYRITRGSWNNAEVIDPSDRFANRTATVPDDDAHTITIRIDDWWDTYEGE